MTVVSGIRSGLRSGIRSGLNPADFVDILIWGQSNSGEKSDSDAITPAETQTLLETVNTAVTMIRRKAATPADPLVWTSDTGPVQPRTDSASENMGWELSFAERFGSVIPGRLRLFRQWIGSSGMHDHWRVDSLYPVTGGDPNLHGSLLSFGARGRPALGIITRGETDALDATDAAAFETDQTAEISAVRTRFGAALPIILSKLSDQHNPVTYTQLAVVRTAQDNVNTNVANVTLVSKDGLALQADGDHLTANSYVTHGYALADEAMTVLGYSRAAFTSSVAPGTRDATFTFAGSGATPSAYAWTFGDGATSTIQNPTHTYAANGTYSVTLAVTGPNGWVHRASADVVAVLPAWDVDSGSSKAVPSSTAQWNTMISDNALTISAPNAIVLCQEGSGPLADSGSAGLVLVPSGSPLYGQAIAGWSRLAVGTTDGTSTQRFRSTQTLLPNILTESMLVLAYIQINNNPAAVRGVLGMGLTQVEMRCAVGGGGNGLARVSGGGQTSTSALNNGTGVRPYVLRINRTDSTQRLFDDRQKLAPAFGTGTQSGELLEFGATIGAAPPTARLLYMAVWFGASAEMSDAQINAMLTALGWTVSGY